MEKIYTATKKVDWVGYLNCSRWLHEAAQLLQTNVLAAEGNL
jgi:hypothetical protein